MNRKATSLVALVVAGAVAAAPAASAGAVAVAPATPVANVAQSFAQVVQNVSGSTGALARPGGAVSDVTAPAVAPLVVVTGESTKEAPASASSDPIALPKVPDAVTSALDLAGLPVAAVWRVFQTGNGIYTVFYKLAFNTIPNALLKGQWGSIPGAINTAINDSLTWITTGAGPKPPATDTATKAAPSAPSVGLAVPPVITNALDVVAIPVATAWATFQAANSVYTNFTSLVSTVPNALLKGQWGTIPTLVLDAVTKSITTIVDFPGSQLDAATEKISKLIASLTPAAPTTTGASSDALTLSRASIAGADDLVSSSLVTGTAGESGAKAGEKSADVAATGGAKRQAAEPTTVKDDSKPVDTTSSQPTAPSESPVAKPADSKPADSKPAETKQPVEEKKQAEEKKQSEDSKPAPAAEPAADSPAPASKTEETKTSASSNSSDTKSAASDSSSSKTESSGSSDSGTE